MDIEIEPSVLITAGHEAVDHAEEVDRAVRSVDLQVTAIEASLAEALLIDRVHALTGRMQDNGDALVAIARAWRRDDGRLSATFLQLYSAGWR